jgi:predicted transcriptional regulator
MEVARVLWQLGEATVRRVHEAILLQRPLDFNTVQTYLRRLEAKGYVRSRLSGRACVYTAKVKPATVIRDTVDDLVDRVFGGEALPLMRHLVENRGIRPEEVAQLREWLDRLEEKRDESRGT